MIRLWFTRGTSIPVREQLIAQLLLGILSRQIAPGEKLPSVRDLARRLRLHPNTISTVYNDLSERGWLEARQGSGVFVRSVSTPAPEMDLDVFIRSCLEEGLRRGFTLTKLQDGFRRIGTVMGTTRSFVVVDPDPELALILAAEIEEATNASVSAATLDQAAAALVRMRETDTFVFATRRNLRHVRAALPNARVNPIDVKSLEGLLTGVPALNSRALLAVVSRSETVLQWAATLLPSLGLAPEAFILRNPNRKNWTAGLSVCSPVAADLRSEAVLPSGLPRLVFRLVSKESLQELNALAGRPPSDLFG